MRDSTSGEASADKPLQDVHILVLDDDLLVQEVINRVLSASGATVHSVSNVDETVAQAQQLSDQGIAFCGVFDINLHGKMGGIAALRQVQQIVPNVRIIACSGYAEAEHDNELLALGFCDYLAKPFRASVLVEKAVLHSRDTATLAPSNHPA